jgi:uncharacterized protein DUF402
MWSEGDLVLRREVRNNGWAWMQTRVRVVRDDPGLLVTYLAEGTPFEFPPGPEVHPWAGRGAWEGHGVLMLQRPDELHAIWVFWEGENRDFACWYVNIQEPFRRTVDGFDTQDLELDVLVWPDGRVDLKDDELLDVRVQEGRFTQDQARATRREAARLIAELDCGRRWWDPWWALWEPDPAWSLMG